MFHKQIRYALLVTMVSVCGLLVWGTLAQESREAKIARATSAAPVLISEDATILDTDGAVLQWGTNGWTCRTGFWPGDTHPLCNDAVWESFFEALFGGVDFKADRVGFSYVMQGDPNVSNTDPFDSTPDPKEMWVQEGPHLMILLPDPTLLEGITDDPTNGGPYVMWKDTPYQHIMLPLGPIEPRTQE